jgi:tRNA(Ile2) C34 agmatinyltransferase TiaS
MGFPELRVLKTVVEFTCPWCGREMKARLGRGPYRCDGCRALIADLQLLAAMFAVLDSAPPARAGQDGGTTA